MDNIRGIAYVVGDNIDTDQILTAEYMKINPSFPEGYRKLGELAFCGLPETHPPFIDKATGKSLYSVVVGGKNFGCGSSRENAPIALGASGIKAVIAQSFARIFLRNCIATGEILPVEIKENLTEKTENGDEIIVDASNNTVLVPSKSIKVTMMPLGPMTDIVKAGGLFPYGRLTGMIKQATA